ncbi:AAA family ATPase [Desemzia sp. FAM 24101]|uniref:AAA family ATPase n=1 Tax=Desemzia sp. FAM 24101 TaxID=3259522 RepID=UPI00388A137C
MKLLKVIIEGNNIFKDGRIEFDFTAQDKVVHKENLNHLFSNIYTQNSFAIAGINASGKTTVLKYLSIIMDVFFRNKQLNEVIGKDLLGNNMKFIIFYYDQENVFKLSSIVALNNNNEYEFIEETIVVKESKKVMSKKKLYAFNDTEVLVKRTDLDQKYLPKDISVNIIQTKNTPIYIGSYLDLTNYNFYLSNWDVPQEVIKFFDSSIEYVRDADKGGTFLKFYSQEEIFISNFMELEKYLSSGTIKGINAFSLIIPAIKNGGYVLIDEIENHFNKTIITTIFNLFKDEKTNPNGATLIFSTHYSELLDEFNRKDNIYITLKDRNNENQNELVNYSKKVQRNDLKKSEVYLSNYIKGTAPQYTATMDLKNYVKELTNEINAENGDN